MDKPLFNKHIILHFYYKQLPLEKDRQSFDYLYFGIANQEACGLMRRDISCGSDNKEASGMTTRYFFVLLAACFLVELLDLASPLLRLVAKAGKNLLSDIVVDFFVECFRSISISASSSFICFFATSPNIRCSHVG